MILVGAVPLLLGGLFLFTFFDNYLNESVGSSLSDVASFKAGELTELLNQRIRVAEQIVFLISTTTEINFEEKLLHDEELVKETSKEEKSKESGILEWQENVAGIYHYYSMFFANISIINEDGDVLFSSFEKPLFEDVSLWTDIAFERRETVVSDVFFREEGGFFGVFTIIEVEDGKDFLMIAEVSDDDFFRTLSIKESDNRDVFLLNNRGLILYSSKENLQHSLVDDTYPRAEAVAMRNGSLAFDVEGQKLIGGFSVIPGLGWHIVVTREEGEALMFLREMATGYVLLAIILILPIILISFLISRRIIRPLKNISLASQRVAKGDFDVKASVTSGDEFGDLASNFNKMTEDLKSAQKKIEEEKQVLEIKVKARTKLLNELNESLESKVEKRTEDMEKKIKDLEKMSKLMIGRELKMVEMKKEMKKLEEEIENKEKYN